MALADRRGLCPQAPRRREGRRMLGLAPNKRCLAEILISRPIYSLASSSMNRRSTSRSEMSANNVANVAMTAMVVETRPQ